MTDTPAVLQFDLEAGQNFDALLAAKALIAWVEAIQEATAVIDPMGRVSVDLLSADAACLRFTTVLNFIEQKVLGAPADGLGSYPRLKKLIAMNVLVLPGAIVGGLVVNALSGDPEAERAQAEVAGSPGVQAKVQTFYKIVDRAKPVERVSISEYAGGPPIISVPRAEFAQRSGLWSIQDSDAATRPGGGEWDVVVTHPVSLAKPMSWGFMRDGLPFRAKMADEVFLAAIRAGNLPIAIQEGVMMRVRVAFTERLDGQTWVPVPGTWRINEVISPKP